MPGKVKVDGPPSVAGDPPRVGDGDRREARRLVRAAHAGNAAYLADDAPTAVATREQVRSLTAQVDALAKLAVGG
jgi:hypothetical protein